MDLEVLGNEGGESVNRRRGEMQRNCTEECVGMMDLDERQYPIGGFAVDLDLEVRRTVSPVEQQLR